MATSFDQTFDKRSGVTSVINSEVGVMAQTLCFSSKYLQTSGVESPDPHSLRIANQVLDSLPHFAGCLIGEGNSQNLRRPGFFLLK